MENNENKKNRDGLLILFYFLIFLFFSWKVPFVVGALILGFYFSVILSVPYDFVMRRFNKKWLAITTYVLVVFIFAYAVISFFPTTVRQIYNVLEIAKNLKVNGSIPLWLNNLFDEFKSNVSSIMISFLNKVFSILPSLVSMVMLLIVTMAGIESIKSYFGKNLDVFFVDDPNYGKKFVVEFFNDVKRYLRGQVLVSFISATLTTIGLFILTIPSAITLGVLAFLGGFFPFIGLILSAIPMYLLALSTGGLRTVIFLTVLLVFVNQMESWFYGPKIQGNNLKLHWFVILVSIFLLGGLLGFVGVLIALPVLLFMRKYWKFYVREQF